MKYRIFIGADHRGFELKNQLAEWLVSEGYGVEDMGAKEYDKDDDYVDFALRVAKKVNSSEVNRGLVICGSGVGVEIAANRMKGVRCGLGLSKEQVAIARKHDDINVLALAADYVNLDKGKELAGAFLETEFDGEERHRRRIGKLDGDEEKWVLARG